MVNRGPSPANDLPEGVVKGEGEWMICLFWMKSVSYVEPPYYVARFPYDTSKELFKSAFIAWVVIMKSDVCIAQIDLSITLK